MSATAKQNVRTALRKMTKDEINRLRWKLWKRFGTILRRISSECDPDDLLLETFEDLLAGRRTWPSETVSLEDCISQIARSKVFNICRKSDRERVLVQVKGNEKYGEPVADHEGKRLEHNLPFPTITGKQQRFQDPRKCVEELFPDDELIQQMVLLRWDRPGQNFKPADYATLLGVHVKTIYYARERINRVLDREFGICMA